MPRRFYTFTCQEFKPIDRQFLVEGCRLAAAVGKTPKLPSNPENIALILEDLPNFLCQWMRKLPERLWSLRQNLHRTCSLQFYKGTSSQIVKNDRIVLVNLSALLDLLICVGVSESISCEPDCLKLLCEYLIRLYYQRYPKANGEGRPFLAPVTMFCTKSSRWTYQWLISIGSSRRFKGICQTIFFFSSTVKGRSRHIENDDSFQYLNCLCQITKVITITIAWTSDLSPFF